MSPEQIRQMATFLAVRTGNTNRADLARDVGRWTAMAAAHTGAVAPTPLAVQHHLPGPTLLNLTVTRHARLLDAGRDAADDGASVGQLRRALRRETRALNRDPDEGYFRPRPAAQRERVALAELMHVEYSSVQRFTDGLPTGNFSYRGKEAVLAHQAPDTDFPFRDEQESRPGQATLVRAAQHFDGQTQGSKFVSVTGHLPSARRTPDPQLQAIMHGSPNRAGAPHIDTFMVPSHGLLRADRVKAGLTHYMGEFQFGLQHGAPTKLAIGEHEELYAHDTLDHYRTARDPNPHRHQNQVGIYDPRSTFAQNLKKYYSAK